MGTVPASDDNRVRGKGAGSARVALLPAMVGAGVVLWALSRCWPYAYHVMFSRFLPHDDEGYVLVSVREFLSQGGLYDRVYTQYGPFYYASKHILSLAFGTPAHDVTRLTTLGIWFAASGLAALAALWMARSVVAALVVLCTSVIVLSGLTNEPGHPQEVSILLVALALAAIAAPITSGLRLAALAGVGAALCLTKINIGVYLLVAVAGTVLWAWRNQPCRRTLMVAYACLAPALPFLVMLGHLRTWAADYAILVSSGLVSLLIVATERRVGASIGWREIARAMAVFAVTAALILMYVMLRGTTPRALVDGVLVRPAALADVFFVPATFPAWTTPLALLSIGVALCWRFGGVPFRQAASTPLRIVKAAAGLYVLYLAAHLRLFDTVGLAIPLLWLLLIPGKQTSADHGYWLSRVGSCLIAAWQSLQAYPVAGSQMHWAAFGAVLWAAVSVADAMEDLLAPARAMPPVIRAAVLVFVGAAVIASFPTVSRSANLRAEYENQMPLALDGSERIHLPVDAVAGYHWLVNNLKGHCSAFVSLPGLNSLHVWSGLPPVTGYNATAWMTLLSEREQQAVVERLAEAPHRCAIYNETLMHGWLRAPLGTVRKKPLVSYVLDELVPVSSARGYQFRVLPDRVSSWRYDYLLAGSMVFGGFEPYPVPGELLATGGPLTIRLWMRTRHSGVLVGVQNTPVFDRPAQWNPLVYVGVDGRLRGQFLSDRLDPMTTPQPANDGSWHHVVLTRAPGRQTLYVDAALIAHVEGRFVALTTPQAQLGLSFSGGWPETNGSWFGYSGELREAVVAREHWSDATVRADYAATRP